MSDPAASDPAASDPAASDPAASDPAAPIASADGEQGNPTSTEKPFLQERINPPFEAGLRRYVNLAVADLANRLKKDVTDIAVVSAEFKTWPNAALGCPRPGMQYIQVPVDGSIITLRVTNKIYRYHAGGAKKPFLCD